MESRAARDLGLVVAVLAAGTRLVDGPALWVATALAVAATVAAMIHVLGTWRPRRIRYERLVLPALATFAAVGVGRLLEPAAWIVVTGPLTWLAVAWVVDLERASPPPFPAAATPPGGAAAADASPVIVQSAALGFAFLAFTAVGGIVPSGLAGDPRPLEAGAVVAIVLLDAAIGALAGYRLVARRGLSWRATLIEVNYCLALAGHLGAVVRIAGIPRLLGPALLTAALYVWVEWRQSPLPIRRSARLRRDLTGLGLAALAAVGLGLLAR